MSAPFKDQLAIDADLALLNSDEFADEITRFIGGDAQDKETLRAIVDFDREVDGASSLPSAMSAKVTDGNGRRVPRYCVLEMLASQEVRDDDKFLVEYCGARLVVNVVRPIGADEALRSILCEYPGNRSTHTPRLRR